MIAALNDLPSPHWKECLRAETTRRRGFEKAIRQIKALRDNGIMVTAVHSHMLTEEPRLFFLHFWGNDDAVRLAKGLRAALDQTNSATTK